MTRIATPTRPGQRAHPAADPAGDYRRIEGALAWLDAHYAEQPTLAEAARHAGLSEHHFQRLFSRWAGISPKKYVQYLTLARAREALERSRSVLDAALEAGLSGPGRLHDLFVGLEAVTPGEYKRRGAGVRVHYGHHDSPFGECLVMATARGICGLAFTAGTGRDAALESLARPWARAEIVADRGATAPWAARAFAPRGDDRIPVRVAGTPFQVKVWEALLRVPEGALVSYAEIARAAGSPGAVRAAGQAVGANPVAWLIPCHRVIRASGALGGYRWGTARKLAMLTREAAHTEAA